MFGDFSIFKEKCGKYTYTTVKFYDGSSKPYRKRFPDTKAGEIAAKQYAREIRTKKATGQLLVQSDTLLGQWIITFAETYLKPKYRPQTYERALYTIKKLEPISSVPLARITAGQIQALYNSYSGELAPATIYKIHKLLNAAFKKAVITRKLKHNPMEAVEPPKTKQDEITIFTFTEILRLFRVLHRKRWRHYEPLFHLLLVTGMRIGELLALQLEDIDFAGREIHISRTKIKRTGNEFNEPKTRAGNRYIPILFDRTLERLQLLRQEGNVTRLTGLLFRTKGDNSLNYNNLRRDWLAICREAQIEVKHIHAFRHTFATVMLARGVPVLEVSRILGHTNATTTLNMYGHAIPGYNKRLIEQFQRKKKVPEETEKAAK